MEQYKAQEDQEIYNNIHIDDLWVYDKLILSKRLGYKCGPAGVPVPEPGNYIVRPITNLYGLGLGSRIQYLEQDTFHIGAGYFWCELFEGSHVSVDYVNLEGALVVAGFSDGNGRFHRWSKIEKDIPFPDVLSPVRNKAVVNCEFIGGKLIEVHFRRNPDFQWGNDIALPLWKSSKNRLELPKNYNWEYISQPEPEVGKIGLFIGFRKEVNIDKSTIIEEAENQFPRYPETIEGTTIEDRENEMKQQCFIWGAEWMKDKVVFQ